MSKLGIERLLNHSFKTNDSAVFRYHTDRDNLLQMIYMIMAGYFEDDASDELTKDPVFKAVLEKSALASQDLTVNEKLDIIGNEYAIPMEKDFREDVSIMCNLSQKIKETGIETGIEMGKREMIMKMYNKGYTTAQIADVAEMDEKQIKDIIKNAELLTV